MKVNSNQKLLIHVEKVSSQASKSNLQFSGFIQSESVQTIANYLEITQRQTVIFCVLVELSLQRMVTVENIARYFKCSLLKVLSLLDEFEVLEKKALVKKRIKSGSSKASFDNISYFVPFNVIDSIRTSDKTKLQPVKNMNLPNLLERVKDIVKERENDIISTQQLIHEIEELIKNNLQHTFIKYLNKQIANTAHKCVAMVAAYLRITGQEIVEIESIPDSIFDDISDTLNMRRELISGRHELVKKNVITIEPCFFSDQETISLSKKSLNVLYEEYPELIVDDLKEKGLIISKHIKEKKLFFNQGVKMEIDNITSIIKRGRFQSYQKAAEKNNINKGITAIFHGVSGTGKTQVVYQIAKTTGRDIMMVDLSQTKNMWFGESEKQVKRIFDNYRQLLSASRVEPVLFINEADGLFSKRTANNSSQTSQTLNTIQNILLQELEDFNGILIATTNLITNLDKAFERRFLFIIEFPRPDKFTRAKIWKNRVPELTYRMANQLGQKFDITGGQIDNQIRKLILKEVTKKNVNTFETLMEGCSKNHGFTGKMQIGFGNFM